MSNTTRTEHIFRCDELNINYGEQCSRKATWVYEKPGKPVLHFCTQHAPKRNRYCRLIDKRSA